MNMPRRKAGNTSCQKGLPSEEVRSMEQLETTASDLSYLHKKFKKVASASVNNNNNNITHVPLVNGRPISDSASTSSTSDEEIVNNYHDTPGGRYQCTLCGLSYDESSVLQKHLRTHTSDRPFTCTECGLTFKTKSNLSKHLKSKNHCARVSEEDDYDEDDEDSDNQTQKPKPYKPKFHKYQQLEKQIPPQDDRTQQLQPDINEVHHRINRLITENQALLENTSPPWFKRRSPPVFSNHNKSANFILPVKPIVIMSTTNQSLPSPQPLNLTLNDDNRKRSFTDKSPSPSAVVQVPKERVLRGPTAKLPRLNVDATPPHPQNPEGSIIKDLLLSTREMQKICSRCNTSFRNVQTYEAHRAYYCHHRLKEELFDEHLPQLHSPGPSLGSTLLVDSRRRSMSLHESHISSQLYSPISKKRRGFEMTDISRPQSRDGLSPRLALQMFGGEVHIRDGKETRTLRIDPGKSNTPPNQLSVTTSFTGVSEESGSSACSSPSQVVVKSNLHSAGSLVQVKSSSTSASSDSSSPNNARQTPTNQYPFPLPSFTPIIPNFNFSGIIPTSLLLTLPTTQKVPIPIWKGLASVPTPYVPGIPGPYSVGQDVVPTRPLNLVSSPMKESISAVGISSLLKRPSILITPTKCKENDQRASTHDSIPLIQVHAANDPKPEPTTSAEAKTSDNLSSNAKFLRPNSLPLKPGTFLSKKLRFVGPTLVSPETPRPIKAYGQLYLNGHAYTYLGLKCSTRTYFCCLHKPQPMYVPQSTDPKLSMYCNWQVRTATKEIVTMSMYDSRQRSATYTIAGMSSFNLITTHSSYKQIQKQIKSKENQELKDSGNELNDSQPKRVKIFEGGFESNEDYTYIRGRGRGRYVCEECGIRCRKPSMLKKHLRTHTDVRPYSCHHCNFSFKTKGNLTKHMKSKAHHKKCLELGIVPVPTTVDDSQIDTAAIARLGQDGITEDTDSEDFDDDDDDISDDEFDFDGFSNEQSHHEAAHGLLDLSAKGQKLSSYMGLTGPCKPKTYPYRNDVSTASSSDDTEDEPNKSERKRKEFVLQVEEPRYYFPSRRDPNQPIEFPVTPTTEVIMPSPISPVPIDLTSHPKSSMQLSTIYQSKLPPASTFNSEPPSATPMLQAYLTARAVRDASIKQSQVHGKQESTSNAIFTDCRATTPVCSTSSSSRCTGGTLTVVASSMCEAPNMELKNVKANKSLTSTSPEGLIKPKAEFLPPGPQHTLNSNLLEDGKSMCTICQKVFSKTSQLRLHLNIHYFERPFRCESCSVSFRTKGHLQKHKRSVSHSNKVSMNQTFGTPTTENPRPFKCADCKIAFRIHGHLAKHLRSKMHIMKLECLGKIPFGTYAEIERCGANLNDIDTTDCDNSLESLQTIAHKLHEKDPAKLVPMDCYPMLEDSDRNRTFSSSSDEKSSFMEDDNEKECEFDEAVSERDKITCDICSCITNGHAGFRKHMDTFHCQH